MTDQSVDMTLQVFSNGSADVANCIIIVLVMGQPTVGWMANGAVDKASWSDYQSVRANGAADRASSSGCATDQHFSSW